MKTIEKYKYIILGAGPSGLAFANKLLQNGEESFLVLEKESEAGGLCRSEKVDKSPLDIGGGHFLDVKRKEVLNFLFSFLPKKEWASYKRKSTIITNESEIDYPFESNIWQLPAEKQIDYLLSISKTELSKKQIPKKFVDWIYWKLGDKIADDYMIPYNEKVWSMDLNKLGTYWLYKLPNVSLRETLLSCLTKQPSGQMPAHAKFLYPKNYGYGEVWKRMAKALGDNIIYNFNVNSIDVSSKLINKKYSAHIIINTIPWKELKFSKKLPEYVQKAITGLEYSSIRVTYHKKNEKTLAHWTYISDKNIPYHRILYRNNFCLGSRGYWTEMNEKRSKMLKEKSYWHHVNKYAYPLNTIEKPKSVKKVIDYFSSKSIYGLGRWGEWEHMNSDVAVEKGISLANKFTK